MLCIPKRRRGLRTSGEICIVAGVQTERSVTLPSVLTALIVFSYKASNLPGCGEFPYAHSFNRCAALLPSDVSAWNTVLNAGFRIFPGTFSFSVECGRANRLIIVKRFLVLSGNMASLRIRIFAGSEIVQVWRRRFIAATIRFAAYSAAIEKPGKFPSRLNHANSFFAVPLNSALRYEPVRINPGTTVNTCMPCE